MTAPSRAASRAPHPLATALALAAVGFALMGVGFCLAHASDAAFGVRP